MSERVPRAELMRSLGKLVRGLSALFWGLPLALLICVKTALTDWLRSFGILPPLACTSLLFFGVWQLGYFQPQERVWVQVLDRVKLLAIINIGLSPFLFWWNKLSEVPFYSLGVGVLTLSSLLFLFNLNLVLQRLVAMLPDENLRQETHLFTSVNMYLLVSVILLAALYFGLQQIENIPPLLAYLWQVLESARQLLFLFLILLPLALTMTIIWKVKEFVLASIFSGE